MKRDYKAPNIEKLMLSVCDIIAASTAVDEPSITPGEYRKVGDFMTWFGQE